MLEPILKQNPDRFVIFPITHQDLWDYYEIEQEALYNLDFDPILHFGYRQIQELEPDLIKIQEKIKNCNHLVLVSPVWWGGLPALARGFFDRAFISGFSHRFDAKKKMPVALLKRKSASVIYTQGAPKFYSFLFTKDVFWKTLKLYILDFSGFSPVKRKVFDKVKSGNDNDRQNILKHCFELGKRGF
ncbi:MAG: NAD(P)H-dependent oxidoreductase [bacterium]